MTFRFLDEKSGCTVVRPQSEKKLMYREYPTTRLLGLYSRPLVRSIVAAGTVAFVMAASSSPARCGLLSKGTIIRAAPNDSNRGSYWIRFHANDDNATIVLKGMGAHGPDVTDAMLVDNIVVLDRDQFEQSTGTLVFIEPFPKPFHVEVIPCTFFASDESLLTSFVFSRFFDFDVPSQYDALPQDLWHGARTVGWGFPHGLSAIDPVGTGGGQDGESLLIPEAEFLGATTPGKTKFVIDGLVQGREYVLTFLWSTANLDYDDFDPTSGGGSYDNRDAYLEVEIHDAGEALENWNALWGMHWPGRGADELIVADYSGDGRDDLATLSRATGQFYVAVTGTNQPPTEIPWGWMCPNPATGTGSLPSNFKTVVGDYDGDGKADRAFYDPTGTPAGETWYYYSSSTGIPNPTPVAFHWPGTSIMDPIPADYDGDGRTDLAMVRRDTGNWFIRSSALGNSPLIWGDQWAAGYHLAPAIGDYTGDGRADIAVFDTQFIPGAWYVIPIENWPQGTGVPHIPWGVRLQDMPGSSSFDIECHYNGSSGFPGDWLPFSSDFDGDGKADLSTIRECFSHQQLFVHASFTGVPLVAGGHEINASSMEFIRGDFDGDGATDNGYFDRDQAKWFVTPSSVADYPGFVQPPTVDPFVDMTENNAAIWKTWSEDGSITLTDDSSRRKVGSSSLRITTTGGFDNYVIFPGDESAEWTLDASSVLRFWAYAENPHSFQSNSPQIRILTSTGHFELRPTGEPLDSAIGAWREFVIPLQGNTSWTLSADGCGMTTADLADPSSIQGIEIHADTWDYGFSLWLDGLRFDTNPTSVTSTSTPAIDFGIDFANPNPFVDHVDITFSTSSRGTVRLDVYDVTGRLVRPLVSGQKIAGKHEISWDGSDQEGGRVASGIYFVRLQANDRAALKRIVRLK